MNILIIRFSSLGDVILIRPVLTALHKKYPKVKVTILSNQNFKSLFDFDNRIRFIGVDLKSKEGKILNLINEVNKKANLILSMTYMMSSGPRLLEIYFPLTLLAFLIRDATKKRSLFQTR